MSFLSSRTRSAREGFGQPVLRKEDAPLLVGAGCYSDDVNLPDQAYACFVRSPHAHARIRRIDAVAALATPGVIAVLTGEHAAADGVKPITHSPVPSNPHEQMVRRGDVLFVAPHPPMPADRVRFVGEVVAMVMADTPAAARDGAERVVVEWTSLPAVTASLTAAAPDAPILWAGTTSNVCVDAEVGDSAAVELAFSRAAHVVRLETWVQRVTGVPMEPRAAIGAWDPVSGRYTVHAGAGGLGRTQTGVAGALGVPESAVRVMAREVGGNFGTRNSCYPEFALVAWAARRLGRAVKWTAERREAFLADYQGRDLVAHAELALDADGTFLAFRTVNTSNVGAHAVSFHPLNKGLAIATTVYRVPAVAMRGRAVLANTSPTTPYRSAGRPEVTFVMERLIDLAARRHGFDRLELRRRNVVPASAMPYRTAAGVLYDSGDYLAALDRAVALADWAGFEARRSEARRRGRHRGIGVANYIEINTGFPRERAHITVRPEGRVDLVLGTLSSGQGHATSFAQLLVEWLGVELTEVRLVTGDTDVTVVGGGAHSARALRLAAVVMAKASDQIVEKGRRIAAWMLEAADADIEFSARRFRVKGTDRSVDLFEAAAAAARADAPEDCRGPLDGTSDETMDLPSFPYGCAVCEVEVDPETGVVEVVRYTTVDDCGRAVNPMILHGQTHGGIAQGVGQALWEACAYDGASGQLLSATLMDYALPRADMLPAFTTEISEVPSTSHPLGLRGGGEGGTTPALGAVVNAICDALADLGVEHIEMPATPERVWQAIHDANRRPPTTNREGHRMTPGRPDAVKEQVAAHWNRRASHFDEDFGHSIRTPAERAAWDRILDLVLAGRGVLDALDAGCGTGFLSFELAARGHRVTGVDFAPAMLAEARHKAAERRGSIRFEEADAEHLPFASGSFDLAISRHLLWTLPHPEAAIDEWIRVLRPRGRLVVVDGQFDAGVLVAPAGSARASEEYAAVSDRLPFLGGRSREEIAALLEAHGLVNVGSDPLLDLVAAQAQRMIDEGREQRTHRRYVVWGDVAR